MLYGIYLSVVVLVLHVVQSNANFYGYGYHGDFSAIPPDATSVGFQYHPINVIPSGAFSELNLTHLNYLSFYRSNISVIEPDAWDGLGNLIVLDINYNRLMKLQKDAFKHLNKLEDLDLYSNQISEMEAGVFQGLTSLIRLNLGSNQISVLEAAVFDGLSSLTEIYLGNNQISVLEPEVIGNLPRLTHLDISGYHIFPWGSGLFADLPLLTVLILDNTNISVLEPDMFSDAPLLTRLDLQYNRISVLEHGTFRGLTILERLDLDHNNIFDIPYGVFTDLPSLESLYLANNKLTALRPGMFQGLRSLELLYVDSNMITSVEPGTFAGLSNINVIWFDGNPLDSLPWNVFDWTDFVAGHPARLNIDFCHVNLICDKRIQWIKTGLVDGWIGSGCWIHCVNLGIDLRESPSRVSLPNAAGYTCGRINCTDIDECATGTHNCQPEEICTNTLGSYLCSCGISEYQDGSTCVPCPDGLTTQRLGSTTIYDCSVGDCGRGEFLNSINQCEPCAIGSYQDITWRDLSLFDGIPYSVDVKLIWQCVLCPPGKSTNGTGKQSLLDCLVSGCPPGFRVTPDGRDCDQCAMGTYNNKDNFLLTECISCPDLYTTAENGSTSIAQCILSISCRPGQYENRTTCTLCEDGTYQDKSSQMSCDRCPDGKPTTGGPGATSVSQCGSAAERQVQFGIRYDEAYDVALDSPNSPAFIHKRIDVQADVTEALSGVRYFRSVTVDGFSRGSVIAHLTAMLLSHSDAEGYLFANLEALYPGQVLSELPEPREFTVTTLEPSVGPQAGGTLVTLIGRYLQVHGPMEITIGSTDCTVTESTEERIVCQTQALTDDSSVDVSLPVMVTWTDMEIPTRNSGTTFTYKPNPVIESIYPNVTVVNGGVPITVTGQNVDSVAQPIMVVTVTLDSVVIATYYQACRGLNENQFECPTPDLMQGTETRRKRQAVETEEKCEFELKYHQLEDKRLTELSLLDTDLENIVMDVEFKMDGANQEEEVAFGMNLRHNPVIQSEDDKEFITQSPCSDDTIIIKGERLLDGLSPDLYSVYVGNEECTEVTVTFNQITCKPPDSEPDSGSIVTVRLGTGCREFHAYSLEYGSSPFDCDVVVFITVGVAAGFILILFIIMVARQVKKNRKKKRLRQLLRPQPNIEDKLPHLTQRQDLVDADNPQDVVASEKEDRHTNRDNVTSSVHKYYSFTSETIHVPKPASGQMADTVPAPSAVLEADDGYMTPDVTPTTTTGEEPTEEEKIYEDIDPPYVNTSPTNTTNTGHYLHPPDAKDMRVKSGQGLNKSLRRSNIYSELIPVRGQSQRRDIVRSNMLSMKLYPEKEDLKTSIPNANDDPKKQSSFYRAFEAAYGGTNKPKH